MKAVVLFGLILFIELDLWKTIFWNSSNLWTITLDLSPLLTHFLWTILYHISFPRFFIFIFSLIFFVIFIIIPSPHQIYNNQTIILSYYFSWCFSYYISIKYLQSIYYQNFFQISIFFHYLYIYSIHYHHSFASFRSLRLILIDILAPFNF